LILGRSLSSLEVDLFTKYIHLLIKWQRSQRLVGSSEPDWIIDHIVLDSLLFARLLPSVADRILDVGSGAGVPGIPLKIALQSTAVTLLEPRAKRVSFLSAVVRELELRDCEILNARLETIAAKSAARFDAIVMRCAGDPSRLREAALQLLRPGGVIVAAGPPKRRSDSEGDWTEIEGPRGRRLFWTTRKLDG
jgi:16S rRNA (guanine527-N7)-methyltransferase